MTIGEVIRVIESKKRVKKIEAQEKASYDYILADLIGKSISRVYHSSNKLPEIYEAYPTLFDSQELQEKKQEKINELSVIRFRQFAASHNKRFKEVQLDK